jgi:uncharacterized protein (TIGR02300 family)
MGLGLKRICLACGAKFYDLEKNPIVCPKCGKKHTEEDFNKIKRARKKVVEQEIPEDDIGLGGAEVELLDEDIEESEAAVIETIEIDDDEDPIEAMEEDSDRLLVEIEEENDDMIESDDGKD